MYLKLAKLFLISHYKVFGDEPLTLSHTQLPAESVLQNEE